MAQSVHGYLVVDEYFRLGSVYSRLHIIGSLWFQSILTRLSGANQYYSYGSVLGQVTQLTGGPNLTGDPIKRCRLYIYTRNSNYTKVRASEIYNQNFSS